MILIEKNNVFFLVFPKEIINYFKIATAEKAKFSENAAMMKIKERKKQADYAKRERDIRRRKIQVEQERMTKETDAKKEQENLLKQQLNLIKDVFFFLFYHHQNFVI